MKRNIFKMTNNDTSKRLLSIDALRGFDMFFIVGLASLIIAVCNLFPGGADCALARNMTHAAWHGFRHHDTIFPLFLFISGMTFPFSYAKQVEKGHTKGQIYGKIFWRGFALVLLGLVYNGLFNFKFSTLRYCGVLQHIGLAWMFSALLFVNFKTSVRAIIAAVILIGYWLLLRYVPAPDMPAGTDPFSIEGNIVGYVDRSILPGRLYQDIFDPEGLLSLFPAIVTAMLGAFTGEFVRLPEEKISGERKTVYMFATAAVMLAVGLVWSKVLPINKPLWTSTFVLVAGAYSVGMFALFYWLIDVKGWRGWTYPFKVVGMNSITIYLAQRIISFRGIDHFFFDGVMGLCSLEWALVVNHAGYLLLIWLFCWFLYKQKIFLKV